MTQAMSAATEGRVRGVIARTFNLSAEQAKGPLAMNQLPAWDSLGHMQLVAALEQEFGLTFPAYAVSELTSVEAIVGVIAQEQGGS
jgi:acyl carrier protein